MLFALLIACGTQAEIVEGAVITVHPDPGVTCYVYHSSISCIAEPWVDIVVPPEEDTGCPSCETPNP